MSSENVSPSSSAWTYDSAAVYPMKSVSNRSIIGAFGPPLGALDPGLRQDRLLLLAAFDEPLGLETLQHLAGRCPRDAEHLRYARSDRRRLPGSGLYSPIGNARK